LLEGVIVLLFLLRSKRQGSYAIIFMAGSRLFFAAVQPMIHLYFNSMTSVTQPNVVGMLFGCTQTFKTARCRLSRGIVFE
jgi:hypothetical protein